MKIGGKSLVSKNYVYIVLTKGDIRNGGEKYRLKVCSLPAGWAYKYQPTGLLDYPKAPLRPRVAENNKVIRKGRDEGGAVEYAEDRTDPKFRKAVSEVNRRVTALRVRSVLEDDENVEFSLFEPAADAGQAEWQTYADALATEVESCLTDEEIEKILEAAEEASCVYEVERAIDVFSETP